MTKILPEFLGLLLAATLLSTVPGCSPAAEQRVSSVVATADRICQIAMANEPLIELAAKRVGKPLDQYIADACAAEAVVTPLVVEANNAAVCPAYPWPTAGAPSVVPLAGSPSR